jgi:hypothetical protein
MAGRRIGAVVAGVAAVGLVLTGCGSKDETATKTSESASSSSSSSSSSSAAPSSTTAAAGANETIDDYLKANGIQQAIVHRGDPGIPELNLPTPPGWKIVPDADAPQTAWGVIALDDPAAGSNPPAIIATMAKLTGGQPDPATLLKLAPNKVRSLPQFDGPETGQDGELGGFQASTIGGTFVQDGVNMLVARKTVVIPASDATYLLALDVQGSQDFATQMMDATAAIDEGTTITVP